MLSLNTVPKPLLGELLAGPNTWIAAVIGVRPEAVRSWRKGHGYPPAAERGGPPRPGRLEWVAKWQLELGVSLEKTPEDSTLASLAKQDPVLAAFWLLNSAVHGGDERPWVIRARNQLRWKDEPPASPEQQTQQVVKPTERTFTAAQTRGIVWTNVQKSVRRGYLGVIGAHELCKGIDAALGVTEVEGHE